MKTNVAPTSIKELSFLVNNRYRTSISRNNVLKTNDDKDVDTRIIIEGKRPK